MAVCVSYILNICECGKRVEKENKMRENTLKSFQAPSLFLFLPSPLSLSHSLSFPRRKFEKLVTHEEKVFSSSFQRETLCQNRL